jgi:hypothetical protein
MFLAVLSVIALSVGSVNAVETTNAEALAMANDDNAIVQVVEPNQGSVFLDQDLGL